MYRFKATLVHGTKAPYSSWTFFVIPPQVARRLGNGPKAIRGTLAGTAFRGTASRGEGVLRMPIPHDLRAGAGVRCGDRVQVELELDPEPRPVEIPDELRRVLNADADVGALFEKLPPAHRRAWGGYVAEAKRPETRRRRAAKAPEGIRARAFPR